MHKNPQENQIQPKQVLRTLRFEKKKDLKNA